MSINMRKHKNVHNNLKLHDILLSDDQIHSKLHSKSHNQIQSTLKAGVSSIPELIGTPGIGILVGSFNMELGCAKRLTRTSLAASLQVLKRILSR
ncbi:hypothetical protein M8J77_016238 [Diaphorina citri]|nr:hypothetical protein M8J77_016238 [Diaphorina citri]